MKKAWQKLCINRSVRDSIVTKNGKPLSETNFAILTLIAHHDGVTIQGILAHPYFRDDVALSTVKRSIVTLMSDGLIKATTSETDRRERLLSVNFED